MLNNALNDASCQETAQLYRDYGDKVNRWATRLAGSASDADDIVQEVFLTVHRRSSSFDDVHCPSAWLLRTTQNVARHLWRSRGRSAKRACAADPQELPSPLPDPFEHLEQRRAIEKLEAAMETLDERYREIYWLCEINCMPSADAASLTGLNPQTLRVRRHRARLQIAKCLSQ